MVKYFPDVYYYKTRRMNKRQAAGGYFQDLSKAFASICYLLDHKLPAFDITGSIRRRARGFLSDRYFTVMVGNHKSGSETALIGII